MPFSHSFLFSASKKHIRFIFRCAFLDRISFFCYHKYKKRITAFGRAVSPNGFGKTV
nr:MAG TPA: AAA domain protein [Caudoviricetes sp.]